TRLVRDARPVAYLLTDDRAPSDLRSALDRAAVPRRVGHYDLYLLPQSLPTSSLLDASARRAHSASAFAQPSPSRRYSLWSYSLWSYSLWSYSLWSYSLWTSCIVTRSREKRCKRFRSKGSTHEYLALLARRRRHGRRVVSPAFFDARTGV